MNTIQTMSDVSPKVVRSMQASIDHCLTSMAKCYPWTLEMGAFIFNFLNLIDALDEQASEIVRFPEGKRVLEIQRFVFRPSQTDGVDVFKLLTSSLKNLPK